MRFLAAIRMVVDGHGWGAGGRLGETAWYRRFFLGT
jgi:hypothetical protein